MLNFVYLIPKLSIVGAIWISKYGEVQNICSRNFERVTLDDQKKKMYDQKTKTHCTTTP